MDEFDLYCTNRPAELRARLEVVHRFIRNALPADVQEGRAHFYLIYHLGSTTVVKLHSDAKGVPVLTFVNGSDLDDPAKLLKGKSLSRTIKLASDRWLETHGTALGDLLRQSYAIMQERWDGHTTMRTLGPDQPSP